MLRVLLLNHTPIDGSGSGTFIDALSQALASLGVKPCVATIDTHSASTTRHGVEYQSFRLELGAKSGWEFPSFTGHPRSALLYGDLSPPAREGYLAGIRTILGRAAESVKPDLVHVNHLFAFAFAATELGLPVVATSHGSEFHFISRQDTGYWRDIVSAASDRVAAITCVSHYVRRVIVNALGQVTTPIEVIHNGFSPAIFNNQGNCAPATSNPVVLGAGRMVPYKRFDLLIRAFEILQSRRLNSRLILAGAGPELPRLRALVDRLRIAGVEFTGHAEQAQLASLYQSADVTVVPSINEPFGLVALESVACGTPVVAASSGALPEIVTAGRGRLVAGDDPESWAQAITFALDMRRRLPIEQSDRGGWTDVAERYLQIYHQVASVCSHLRGQIRTPASARSC